MSKYKLKIGAKTRFLNFFRQIFKFSPFEDLLVRKIPELDIDSPWVRLMPPNYLYPKNSWRDVSRNGINYHLDISDYIEHAVYFGYQDRVQDDLFRLAENKKVVIDVGVNIGAVLLNFACHSPEGSIIGFEPDERNFQKAKANLELNKLDNIEIIRKGLGSETTRAKIFKVNENNEGMNRILVGANLPDGGVPFSEIEIIRLDDFAAERGFESIDLIKIDVEGYELNVLRGAEQTLREFSPTLFIEVDDNNLKAQNGSARALVLFLKGLGYDVVRADNRQQLGGDEDFGNCHFDVVCERPVA